MNSASGYTNLPATVIAALVPGTCLLNNQDILRRWNVARGTLHKEVHKAYEAHRQTEIISWKSGFHLQRILHEGCRNEQRVQTTIFLVRLCICLFMQKIYARYKKTIARKTGKRINLLEWALYISGNRKEILPLPRMNKTDLYQQNLNYPDAYPIPRGLYLIMRISNPISYCCQLSIFLLNRALAVFKARRIFNEVFIQVCFNHIIKNIRSDHLPGKGNQYYHFC